MPFGFAAGCSCASGASLALSSLRASSFSARSCRWRPSKSEEPGVLHDDFTVEDGSLAAEASPGCNYPGISVRPVITVPRKGAHRTAVKHEQRAITVMLDFVNPAVPFGGVIRKGGKLGSTKERR